MHGLFLAPGAVFALCGVAFGAWAWISTIGWVPTTGKVAANQLRADSDSADYVPEVEFMARDGRPYCFVSSVGSAPPRWSVGDVVPVLYDPTHPGDAVINTFYYRWLLPVGLCVFGAGLAYGGHLLGRGHA